MAQKAHYDGYTPNLAAFADGGLQSSSTELRGPQQVARSSTRLHAPPGGASQISFGDYTSPAASRQTKIADVHSSSIFATPEPVKSLISGVGRRDPNATTPPLGGHSTVGAGSSSFHRQSASNQRTTKFFDNPTTAQQTTTEKVYNRLFCKHSTSLADTISMIQDMLHYYTVGLHNIHGG